MLSNTHFYHRITRKLVVAFGSMFNNLKLYRYNKAGTVEIERVTVPLTYAPKEKFYSRITQDPSLNSEVEIVLPRMSFELSAITYDPLRKTPSFNKMFAPSSNTEIKSVVSTPYNFDFQLHIYVRNTEDGTQIIEQILPYFSPDYTVTIDLISLAGLKVDVPIILNSVSYDVTNDTGEQDQTRTLIWTLSFTAKGYLYGPISDSKIIRKVTANTYYDTTLTGARKLTLNNGTLNYRAGELVYEGRTLEAANVTAFVESWQSTSNTLIVKEISGVFASGRKLTGAVTGSSWNIVSFDTNPYQMENLTLTPNPNTANANDDFGFTEVLVQYD